MLCDKFLPFFSGSLAPWADAPLGKNRRGWKGRRAEEEEEEGELEGWRGAAVEARQG